MRQKRFPCCKEPMNDSDIFALISDSGITGSSCPDITCPHCGKTLTVFLNIDSVEVAD